MKIVDSAVFGLSYFFITYLHDMIQLTEIKMANKTKTYRKENRMVTNSSVLEIETLFGHQDQDSLLVKRRNNNYSPHANAVPSDQEGENLVLP